MTREQIQQLFIRTCRDSGFGLEASEAANLVGRVAKISPLEVWTAFGALAVMDAIARGEHPASRREIA